MLKTRASSRHNDQAVSQSVDQQSDPVGRSNTTKPLALSLLIGLNNNKCISDSDFVRSPKSPLEFKVLSTMAEPFFLRSPRSSLTAHLHCCSGPAKVGLSIVDSLADDRVLSPDVVFGPALRIKCSEIRDKHPKLFTKPKIEKERSGVVFEIGENSSETEPIGLKTRSFSANDCLRKSRVLSRSKLGAEGNFPEIGSDTAFSCCLSEDDLEMSEDYTCIIAHGPNPKTTHIYGDRVLECRKDEFKEEKHIKTELYSAFPLDNFLSVCNFCNKKLEVGEDLYMYRGEKAFCSEECRSEEMMIDEEDLEDSSITMHESLKKLF